MISIVNSDARNTPLADNSVQCVITSPPYYGLRDYGVAGQIGLERTPQEYVDGLVGVFREVWRVCKLDATVWLNLGDSYGHGTTAPGKRNKRDGYDIGTSATSITDNRRNGLTAKQLVGIPWRVAFALQADGWYLRSDIIWHKPNPMPESVTDRPTKAHEYIFLLTKSERYFYDAEAIAEKSLDPEDDNRRMRQSWEKGKSEHRKTSISGFYAQSSEPRKSYGTRNRRTVWTIATSPYSGAHFATFPPKLVEPMILAGSRPGDIVLDPFAGSGTVGKVCIEHRRQFVGLELNPAYIELAQDRTSNVGVRML